MGRRKLITIVALSSWVLPCGASGSSPTDASAADTSVGSDGAMFGPLADGGTESSGDARAEDDAQVDRACAACPASPPDAGAPCSSAGLDELVCEYGDDPRLVNVFARCFSSEWFYGPPTHALADSGLPIGDVGCPPTFAEAEIAPSCDTPSCNYPEGACTCDVDPGLGQDAGTYWACASPPLAAGCPNTLSAAQSDGTCPSYGFKCFYPGGTCICGANDAGSPWHCTVPGAGCPATRPRIGTACDPGLAKECAYIPIGCSDPTGDLICTVPGAANPPSSCGGVWVSRPGARCR